MGTWTEDKGTNCKKWFIYIGYYQEPKKHEAIDG